MPRVLDRSKLDVAVVAAALNNTNVTGRYFSMTEFERAVAILNGGAMAATKTTTIEILQASSETGTGAKGIPSTAGQAATAQVTANAKVTEVTLTLATVLNTHAVTINGVTFTAHTDTTTAANREFAINGDDTADAAALAGLINNATYGVPGIVASAAAAVITLRASDGAKTITITDAAATITPATTKAQAFVEFNAADLDSANGFTWVAVKITTTANSVVAASLLRSGGRHSPKQSVGASAAI